MALYIFLNQVLAAKFFREIAACGTWFQIFYRLALPTIAYGN